MNDFTLYPWQFGSSPRARGTEPVDWLCLMLTRFIPAGAGNRSFHACLPSGPDGSSPRARGTVLCGSRRCRGVRFIPAGAGNSAGLPLLLHDVAVHPRGRGEQDAELVGRDIPAGSSPRARGTEREEEEAQALERFIPAGAGNSDAPKLEIPEGAVHPRGRGEQDVYGNASYGINGSSPRARGTG